MSSRKARIQIPSRHAKVFGYMSLELQCFSDHRMDKGQLLGMEPETPTRDCLAVEGIGVDGISYRREVNTDLVCAPRLQVYPHHRVSRGFLYELKVRNRRHPYPRRHEGAVRSVSPHRGVDGPRVRQPLPDDQGPIDALYVPPGECRRQPSVGLFALGKHHESGRVSVQAVYDPRPLRVLPA